MGGKGSERDNVKHGVDDHPVESPARRAASTERRAHPPKRGELAAVYCYLGDLPICQEG